MVAGRNSSGIASELGSMKVTEQIDAMRALGTDPVQKLVTPRMIATAIMLPCLTVIDDFVGMVGGWVIGEGHLFGLHFRQYWSHGLAGAGLERRRRRACSSRSFFRSLISLIGCFYGLRATGGTQGVGRATTQAVVVASVVIFILDLFLGKIFVSQSGFIMADERGQSLLRFENVTVRFRPDGTEALDNAVVRRARRRDAHHSGRGGQRQNRAAEDGDGADYTASAASVFLFDEDVTGNAGEASFSRSAAGSACCSRRARCSIR